MKHSPAYRLAATVLHGFDEYRSRFKQITTDASRRFRDAAWREAIQDAFFSYDWEGTQLAEEFGRNGESQFIPITFEEQWAVIRQIDEANDVTYNCQ